MNYEGQLTRIEEKLRRLGINISKSFNPPVSQVEIEEFEQAHQINLPEDYKLFITRIGNGGFGPYLDDGFLPLAQTVAPHLTPSLPFPYATAQKVPYWDNQTDAELKELMKFYHNAENAHGNILLSEYGCGIFAILIVQGEAYGQVWLDQRESEYGGVYPTSPVEDCVPAEKPLTFLEWYETWLDIRINERSKLYT